jgi:hypothetical protein
MMGKGLAAFRALQKTPAEVSPTVVCLNSEISQAEVDTVGSDIPLTRPPSTQQPSRIEVSFQKVSYDWAIADGTYTPTQLQKAKMIVKPWGPVQSYTIDISEAGMKLHGALPPELNVR